MSRRTYPSISNVKRSKRPFYQNLGKFKNVKIDIVLTKYLSVSNCHFLNQKSTVSNQ